MNCPFLLFYYAINNAEKTREQQGFHALFRERCKASLGENGKQVSPCVIEAFLVINLPKIGALPWYLSLLR